MADLGQTLQLPTPSPVTLEPEVHEVPIPPPVAYAYKVMDRPGQVAADGKTYFFDVW